MPGKLKWPIYLAIWIVIAVALAAWFFFTNSR